MMNSLYDWGNAVKVKAGQINGPTYLTAGDEPYVVATLSCPFLASRKTESVSAPETTPPVVLSLRLIKCPSHVQRLP